MDYKHICILLTGLLFGASFAKGHDRRRDFNVDEAIRSADLVFLGSVVKVQYANSRGDSARLESLPHTFVTYQIQRLLKGNPQQAQSEITLRFLGGRGKEADFLYPANFPLFDIRDMDVVFVKGNRVNSCPLILCAGSRLRALQDLIFNERGQQVVLTPRQQIAFGKFEPREEILTHQVSQTLIKAVPSKEESEGPPEAELPVGRQMNVEALVSFIDARVKQFYTPEQLNRLPVVPSASIQEPFSVKPIASLKPKNVRPFPVRPIRPPSAADLLEEKEYRNNNQNPVIRH